MRKAFFQYAAKIPSISIQDYQSVCKDLGVSLCLFLLFDLSLSPLLNSVAATPVLLVSGVAKIALLLLFMKLKGYVEFIGHRLPLLNMLFSLFLLFVLNILITVLFRGDADFLFPADSFQGFIMMLMLAAAVIFEELMFRAYLLEAMKRLAAPRGLAMFLAGILFSIGHIYLGLQGVMFAFFSSLVLSHLYYRSGGAAAGMFVHFAYNIIVLRLNGY